MLGTFKTLKFSTLVHFLAATGATAAIAAVIREMKLKFFRAFEHENGSDGFNPKIKPNQNSPLVCMCMLYAPIDNVILCIEYESRKRKWSQ